ncbi:MAG: DUF4982 domain-containing protein [Solobacterium sp.]|nr:DUF4982 domain-containing protein [Solobacterium sp.]
MRKIRFNDDWTYCRGSGSAIENMFGNTLKMKVALPHDASVGLPRTEDAKGGSGNGFFQETDCCYTKTFTAASADCEKEFFLEFEGVYQNVFVYVNGAFAGKHPYGYTPFILKITEFLDFGQSNTVKVVIKNNVASGRWYTGTGIYRDVNLLICDRLHLAAEGIHLTTVSAEDDVTVIQCDTKAENTGICTHHAELRIRLLDSSGNTAAECSSPFTIYERQTKLIRQYLYVRNAQLWEPDSPSLYSFHAEIIEQGSVVDEEMGTFGIRVLSLDPVHGLRINGKSIKLRGGCIHHDNGIIGTAEFPHAAFERIRKLKDAGYNAVRSAHHPMSRCLLDACDRLGMLVMDEFSDVWTNTKVDYDYGMHMSGWWQQDITAMVNKDYNHPSVILYSIGNEISEAGNRHDVQMGAEIASLIRRLDQSRYTVNCINFVMCMLDQIAAQYLDKEDGTAEINTAMDQLGSLTQMIVCGEQAALTTQEAFAQVDVAGYNYAAARYRQDGSLYPNRIIVGSETNPQALDMNWELVKELPYVIGDFSWTAWDYLGEAGIGRMLYDEQPAIGVYADYPFKAAYCGDFNLIADRRPVSCWREIIWGRRSQPYLAVRPPEFHGISRRKTDWCFTDALRSWNWPGYEGKPVTLEAYTDAEEAELYINGRLIERKSVGTEKKAVVLFETVYMPGTAEIVVYSAGRERGRDRIITAEDDVVIKAVSDRKSIPADGSDICYIDVTLTDHAGNINPGIRKTVSVSVEGPAVIQGYGSADPAGIDNYYDTSVNTYEGRLRTALRASGRGKITVRFAADDCEAAAVSVTAV